MSRKWNNIKYAKAAKDKQRAKILAKFGIEIYVAARDEPDPEINRNLQMVIDKAKTYDVPRDIIERALEKARNVGGDDYQHYRYEGYGPGGSAIILDCLSNNVNRTVSKVRATFSKYGGTLGVNGSVTFMFDQVAIVAARGISEEEVLEQLINFSCEISDLETVDDEVITYGLKDDFHKIKQAYQALGVKDFSSAEIVMLPQNYLNLDKNTLNEFLILIDHLEDIEDVQNLYHNISLE